MTLTKNSIALVAVALFIAAALIYLSPARQAEGNVPRGGEYQGTTTVSTPGLFPAEAVLRSVNGEGSGTLGSVTITGASAGRIDLYDATTSSTALRATNMSSSTLLLASFPASTAAGTYTFDRIFVNGLYVVVSGVIPTSTIMYR